MDPQGEGGDDGPDPAPASSPRVWYGGPGVEHPGMSLSEYTLQQLRIFAKEDTAPAQVDGYSGREDSFSWMLARCVEAACGWTALGLGPGDTVAVVCYNAPDLFPCVIGAVFSGCTVALMFPESSLHDLQEAFPLVRPRAVLSSTETQEVAAQAAEEGMVHVVVTDQEVSDKRLTMNQLYKLGQARGADADTYQPVHVADLHQHVVAVLFSSGSTGKPKACLLSDYSFLAHSLNPGSWDMLRDERFLITSSLSWVSGILMLFHCTHKGTTRVVVKMWGDEHLWLKTIQQYKISMVFAPPWLLALVPAAMADARAGAEEGVGPGGYDLSGMRAMSAGGAALSSDVQAAAQKALGCTVSQGYGCTEAGVAFSDATGLPGQPPSRPGSLGYLQPWVHLRLVDPATGQDAPEVGGECIGEARYKSPFLMLGYAGNPAGNAKAFDEHGFYCTGDMVRRDASGYYYFLDRIKEVIKYNNWQVAAGEVEDVLLSHPLIREACVLGRPHPVHTDLPAAFVVRVRGGGRGQSIANGAHGANGTKGINGSHRENGQGRDVEGEQDDDDLDSEQQLREELHQLTREKLADYKLLRGGIYFLDELPKTSSGKKDRKRLKERLLRLEIPQDYKDVREIVN